MSQQSEDISDEDYNYKQLLQLNKEYKSKKSNRPGSRLPKEIQKEQKQALKLCIFGNFNEAFEKLKAIMTVYPKNPELYYLAGMMYELNKQKTKAAHYYSLNAQLSPPDFERWQKIGNLYFQTQYYEEAAYYYGRALKSSSLNVDLLKKRAESFERCHEYKKAIAMYNKIILISKDVEIIKQCAKLYVKNNQYDKARQLLEQVKANNINVIYMICQTYIKEEKYKEAYSQLNEGILNVITLSELPIQLNYIVILCQIHLEINITEALNIMLAKYNQANSEHFDRLVETLENLNQFQLSVQILEFLIHVATVPDYFQKLANLYKKISNITQAISVLQQGIVKFPNSKALKTQLGFLRLIEGDEADAINLIQDNQQIKSEEQKVFLSDGSQEMIEQVNPKQKSPPPIKEGKRKQKQIKQSSLNKPKKKNRQQKIVSKIEILSILENLPNLLNQNTSPQVLISFYRQVTDLLQKLIEISNQKKMRQQQIEQKTGLFERLKSKSKRKYKIETQILLQEQKIAQLLANWLEQILVLKCWNKISNLSTLISKVSFLSKYPLLKNRIYRICVLACLNLPKKYKKAFFFVRYLLNNDQYNVLYLLLGNLLVRKIRSPALSKFLFPKSKNKNLQSLLYLIAYEHMQSGYFEHSVKALSKIKQNQDNELMINLSLSACFLQLASSRNTDNKLAMVNRSTYFFKLYQNAISKQKVREKQLNYNTGRYFAQLKITNKAIQYFNKVLEGPDQQEEEIEQKAVYCLLCIYKSLGNQVECKKLSKMYLSVK